MPKKSVKQKDTPELFAKVFKVINGLKDKRSFLTVHSIAKEIHAKLEQMGLKLNSRNVLIQVRRVLKFGVQKNLFLYKAGKYRLAIAEATSRTSKSSKPSKTSKPSKKKVVPLDSFELLKSQKSKRKSRPSENKKNRRCTLQSHTSSCRKRCKKRGSKPNKRYLSRKCKSRYYLEPTNNKSSKASSNSDENTSQQLGASTGENTNAENNKSDSCESQEVRTPPTSSDINHWDNKQEAIDKSKYGKQSRKSRMHSSSYHGSATNSDEPRSRKNKKRKMKNLKDIDNLSADNAISGLSTSTAIAAAIMIMMSLWYGYR